IVAGDPRRHGRRILRGRTAAGLGLARPRVPQSALLHAHLPGRPAAAAAGARPRTRRRAGSLARDHSCRLGPAARRPARRQRRLPHRPASRPPAAPMMDDAYPWLVLLAGAGVTYAWRGIGVLLSGRIDAEGPLFRWIGAVAYALLAALIARMIVLPIGPLAATALVDR